MNNKILFIIISTLMTIMFLIHMPNVITTEPLASLGSGMIIVMGLLGLIIALSGFGDKK